MPKTESALEREVVKWCQAEGYLCLKLAIIGLRGFPDRTIIDTQGRFTFAELKRPNGGELSPHQVRWVKILRKFRQTVIEARTLEEVIEAVRRTTV
jgi:hypothetical protein